MKKNLKIGSKKTITAQVCKRMKSSNCIEDCILAHSNHPRGEKRMEGSLLEAFAVRLSIVNEGTEVQIPTAAAFFEP